MWTKLVFTEEQYEMAWSCRGKYKYLVCALVFMAVTFFTYKNLPDGVATNDRHSMDRKDLLENAFSSEPLTKNNLRKKFTIIIREFEDFENKLVKTVEHLEEALGPVPILIISDSLPYPPIKLNPHGSAKIVSLSSDLQKNYSSGCITHLISTEYVLIIPDGVVVHDWQLFKNVLPSLNSKNTKAVAVAVGDSRLECSSLHVNIKEWTISFQANDSSVINDCPFIQGAHGLVMYSHTLKSFAEPFARPFPLSFYIQMRIKGMKTRIMKSARLVQIATLYTDPHSSWKHKEAQAARLRAFYHKVGIKKEILSPAISQYFGCTKTSTRCFGTVINDMPQYLYEGKWTPPCCLKALRETTVHVFGILEQHKVRYWLEGGSLLGAARNGDIIPWDYDVDIGIYREDISKCPFLVKAMTEKYIDDKDFVWDKASEGDFYRVQYSETNHLHVDIFPFYSKDGIMTKDTWMPTHKQDTEFSEKYLNPLTRIRFAGIDASAPNSVREFLQYKFGDGVIENPKYPNYQKPVI